MEKAIKMVKLVHSRKIIQPWSMSTKNSINLLVTWYCKDHKKSLKEMENNEVYQPSVSPYLPTVKVWNEGRAIKKVKKSSHPLRTVNNMADMVKILQDINKFPITLTEFVYYLERRSVNRQLLEQKYLPERHATLKADLAAAHFILRRGGSVKLVGKNDWLGVKKHKYALPCVYVPGIHIEAINAEGTDLIFEGLKNLHSLRFLSSLSLKGLKDINNWCLDWISQEYSSHLEHLDISDCKGVTYRGLSCFYRFQNLKTLKVKGISESPEFKLACIMLQEVFPHLEIEGIDLSIPKKVEAANLQDEKISVP